METRLNKLSVTWSVHAVKCWHQAIVLQSLVITLLQQGPDVGAAPSLWQQPAIELGCQHLRVVFEDGSSKSDGVCHKVNFLPCLRILNVLDSILKVT